MYAVLRNVQVRDILHPFDSSSWCTASSLSSLLPAQKSVRSPLPPTFSHASPLSLTCLATPEQLWYLLLGFQSLFRIDPRVSNFSPWRSPQAFSNCLDYRFFSRIILRLSISRGLYPPQTCHQKLCSFFSSSAFYRHSWRFFVCSRSRELIPRGSACTPVYIILYHPCFRNGIALHRLPSPYGLGSFTDLRTHRSAYHFSSPSNFCTPLNHNFAASIRPCFLFNIWIRIPSGGKRRVSLSKTLLLCVVYVFPLRLLFPQFPSLFLLYLKDWSSRFQIRKKKKFDQLKEL